MSTHSANRARRGGRIERLIWIAAPLLDLALLAGERLSRVLEPDEPDYAPPRMPGDGEAAPRGLRHPVGQAGSR
jgi:hypothetical protein